MGTRSRQRKAGSKDSWSFAMNQWLTLLTLTLIHPASKWTHWATPGCHSCLSRTATSASSQVRPIFCKSLLIALLQFVCGRPWSSPVPWNLPVQCLMLCISGDPFVSRVRASEVFFFSQYVIHDLLSSSVLALTSSFVTLSFQEMPSILLYHLCHLWWAASSFYRAMHIVLARYCYRKSSVRPSVDLSVCDVAVSWAHSLD